MVKNQVTILCLLFTVWIETLESAWISCMLVEFWISGYMEAVFKFERPIKWILRKSYYKLLTSILTSYFVQFYLLHSNLCIHCPVPWLVLHNLIQVIYLITCETYYATWYSAKNGWACNANSFGSTTIMNRTCFSLMSTLMNLLYG